jgi:hypothetical protein
MKGQKMYAIKFERKKAEKLTTKRLRNRFTSRLFKLNNFYSLLKSQQELVDNAVNEFLAGKAVT